MNLIVLFVAFTTLVAAGPLLPTPAKIERRQTTLTSVSCGSQTAVLPVESGVTFTCAPPSPTTTLTPAGVTGGINGFPCTSTAVNGALIAFQSEASAGGDTTCLGSSTTAVPGTTITINVATPASQTPQASINFGTLSGSAIFTSISSALNAACPTPTNNAHTSCNDVESIDNVAFIDTSNILQTTGSVTVGFNGLPAYFTSQGRLALITGLASTMVSTATNKTITPGNPAGFSSGPHGLGNLNPPPAEAPVTIFTVASNASATYINAGTNQPVETIEMFMGFEEGGAGGDFACAEASIAADAIGLIALIPGFEFLGFVAAPAAAGLSAGCGGADIAGG